MARATYIQIRVTPDEKARIQAAAEKSGQNTSEFLRREAGLGRYGRSDLMRRKRSVASGTGRPVEHQDVTPEKREDDLEAAVEHLIRTRRLPRRSAEILARRERARSG